MRIAACALALILAAGAALGACGPAPGPCDLPGGTYHLMTPDGPGPFPAVVFLHGYGGSGQGTLRNTGMVGTLLARGYAVVAPDGQAMPDRDGRTWDFHPDRPATRDEVAFIRAVAEDAARRFALSRDGMLLAGFSIGGSMTSYLACAAPAAFSAYAPVGGSFWRPEPALCAAPVRILHTHGWTDQVVPLEGRAIRPDFVQGDVFAAMQTWRRTNGCARMQPDAFPTPAGFLWRSWTDCAPRGRLDLALHAGGHTIPEGWAALALDWFEALP
jgi:polyhydroxybutyrate depolymerase